MPDMRGHGRSTRVQLGDDVDMAADVADLIRQLGLDRPIVGGHSMGAMVTYQLGLRFPASVRPLCRRPGLVDHVAGARARRRKSNGHLGQEGRKHTAGRSVGAIPQRSPHLVRRADPPDV